MFPGSFKISPNIQERVSSGILSVSIRVHLPEGLDVASPAISASLRLWLYFIEAGDRGLTASMQHARRESVIRSQGSLRGCSYRLVLFGRV